MAVLRISNISKFYEVEQNFFSATAKRIKALDKVSFDLAQGRTLGLVGESGSGKSTLAKIILKLIEPSSGHVYLNDREICALPEKVFRPLRKEIQIVFQDPYSSLSPRLNVKDIIAEPLRAFRVGAAKVNERMRELIEAVGLNNSHLVRYPFQLSGGERQRVGIARALATSPKMLILDEAVSSLDVSTQAQVLNLLIALQKKFRLTYLFIAHDLNVVRYISDDLAVVYRGMIVEKGAKEDVYRRPSHPYTRLLLESMPSMYKRLLDKQKKKHREREIKSQDRLAAGCCFYEHCPQASDICAHEKPPLKQIGKNHWVRCLKK